MKISQTGNIETISKESFNKLSKSEKQIAVAKDVLDRIKFNQLRPTQSRFCQFDYLSVEGNPLNPIINSVTNTCCVCAKGGLFLSYIGIVNDYSVSRDGFKNAVENNSKEMGLLSKIFSKRQLSMIETAFEGGYFKDWNENLSQETLIKCYAFNNKHMKGKNGILKDGTSVLVAICKNIIKNKGKFNP